MIKKVKTFKIGIALFFLVALLDSIGILSDTYILRIIFRPLIFPVLGVVYILITPKINKLYIIALVLSTLADVLLLNTSIYYFILSLGLFLIMHLLYLVILTETLSNYKPKRLMAAAIPYIVVFIFIIVLVKNNTPEFLYLLVIYGFVLWMFCTLAFYNFLEKRSKASTFLLIGTFFYMTSNCMYAIENFRLENKDYEVGTMFTFVIAQFFIFLYLINRVEPNKNIPIGD